LARDRRPRRNRRRRSRTRSPWRARLRPLRRGPPSRWSWRRRRGLRAPVRPRARATLPASRHPPPRLRASPAGRRRSSPGRARASACGRARAEPFPAQRPRPRREGRSPRARPVELPVADDVEPPLVPFLADAEARDDALAALVVAVEQVDGELTGLDERAHLRSTGVLVAECDLPVARLPRRDVQVDDEPPERVERRGLRVRAAAELPD